MSKKTPEQIEDEQRRYSIARTARTPQELEVLIQDPNQAIRAEAAANPNADAKILEAFAQDKFWGTRMEVARHPGATPQLLLAMLEWNPTDRGVVHHAVKERLMADGFQFGDDGMPL